MNSLQINKTSEHQNLGEQEKKDKVLKRTKNGDKIVTKREKISLPFIVSYGLSERKKKQKISLYLSHTHTLQCLGRAIPVLEKVS